MLFEQVSVVVIEDEEEEEVVDFVDREEERLGELLVDSGFWDDTLVERDCFEEF